MECSETITPGTVMLTGASITGFLKVLFGSMAGHLKSLFFCLGWAPITVTEPESTVTTAAWHMATRAEP